MCEQCYQALHFLVSVKDYKDEFGKDDVYRARQPVAWQKARAALDACPRTTEDGEG